MPGGPRNGWGQTKGGKQRFLHPHTFSSFMKINEKDDRRYLGAPAAPQGGPLLINVFFVSKKCSLWYITVILNRFSFFWTRSQKSFSLLICYFQI